MSAPNTSSTPSTPASQVDLTAGKDLTTLDDAALLGELGFDAPEGASETKQPTPGEIDEEVIQSVVDKKPEPAAKAAEPEPEVETPDPEQPNEASTTPEAAKPAPAAQFTVHDKEGELEVPELFISFTADGGKTFAKTPLDKVVRLAQQGQYNHRLQQEVQTARETHARLSTLEQELTAEREARATLVAATERLLTDEAYLDKVRQEFDDYNSPDAQIARLRDENARLKQSPAQRPSTNPQDQASQFFERTAMPAIESIATQFSAVTGQELLGQFILATGPLMVNGRIPPTRFDDVARILTNEIAPWAQQLHEERVEDQRQREAAKKAAERAKQATITTKRQLARAIKPTGGRAAPDVPKVSAPRNADEASDQILADVLSNVGA